MHSRYVFLLLLVTAVLAPARSQDLDQMNKLRLAQEFESAGYWERATALYEELLRAEPSNYVFFDGLRRCYAQLKEYDKAITITEQRITLQPRDPVLMTALAGLHYDAGSDSVARVVWNSVVALGPSNPSIIQLVAREMLEHRLYDDVIALYRSSRFTLDDPAAFANELSNLFGLLQRYPEAIRELLLVLRSAPDQLPFVQSQLSPLLGRPEALSEILPIVAREAQERSDDVALHRLLAWLYAERRDYSRAFISYQRVDELTRANGNEIFQFAQRLLQERSYAPAAEAFQSLLSSRQYTQATLPLIRFGYARSSEELGALNESVELYRSLVDEFPATDAAAQSMFRLAIIYAEQRNDLDSALIAFRRIPQMPRSSAIVVEAAVQTAEVLLRMNRLAETRTQYVTLSRTGIVAQQDLAAFRLAELDYFEGAFDTCLSRLDRFNANATGDLANDALRLQYFVRENLGDPTALSSFSKADLAMRQRRLVESLQLFADVRERFPNALFQDDALMRIGELNALLERPDSAIAAFRIVTDSMALSIWKDRAQFRIAEIYERQMKDAPRATAAYEELLLRYPTSLYADEARQRVRRLR
ncbi:MAG: tetratricopeptide repeat protein [Bacteroidetes bacterium]|nr:tetratricopeptide repeat protein [Bacteroidota bacterium]